MAGGLTIQITHKRLYMCYVMNEERSTSITVHHKGRDSSLINI